MLHRPSDEFGMYFLLFPFGFLFGASLPAASAIASPTKPWCSPDRCSRCAVAVQSSLLLSGHLTPLTLFAPGFFITFAQGVSLWYAQAGAIAIYLKLAGTAAGVGVFVQNFFGATFAQLYGLLADGTPVPLVHAAMTSAMLGLAVGALPFLMARQARAKGVT